MDHELRERLINILLILLIGIAAIFLTQSIWQLLSNYSDILLLFVLAWLVSFMLNPLAAWLKDRFKLAPNTAVLIVYVFLVLVIILLVVALAPPVITQLTELARHLPEYMQQASTIGASVQDALDRRGIRLNVEQAVQAGLTNLQNYAMTIVQNALSILTGVLGVLANLFFILLLSVYITIDGARLRNKILSRVPAFLHDEIGYFTKSVDRTFGGFLRSQVIQAGLVSITTTLAMSVMGLQFALTAGLFAGLFMLIPMVGPFLALIPPALVTIVQAPQLTVWLVLVLFLFQFGLTNIVMPRFLGEALGLHPLLVFAAILFGVKIGGFWGAFFGIPVAGVIWAMVLFLFNKWTQERANDETQKQNFD